MTFKINPLMWKPQMVLGAVLAAIVPIGAVVWKTSSASSTMAAQEKVTTTRSNDAIDAREVVKNASVQSPSSAQEQSLGGIQAWFEGSSNSFLTTAQAKDRKTKDAIAKVEMALKSRGDVESIFILVDESADALKTQSAETKSQATTELRLAAKQDGPTDKNEFARIKPKAVVSIRMRAGALPVTLVDSAGSLLSAALVNVNAEDIEVLDERSGARVRARTLDANASNTARENMTLAAECDQEELQLALNAVNTFQSPNNPDASKQNQPPQILVGDQDNQTSWSAATVEFKRTVSRQSAWTWFLCAIGFISGAVGIAMWRKRGARAAKGMNSVLANSATAVLKNVNQQHGSAELGKFEFWSAPLACALHKCVAEKPALIAAALGERLENTTASGQEVATFLLELEPWAAERILAVLPNRSLDALESAIKQPAAPVAAQHVRALAEAMLSLRNAA
jgi:hypothetical protein